jgi:hypothetical protein
MVLHGLLQEYLYSFLPAILLVYLINFYFVVYKEVFTFNVSMISVKRFLGRLATFITALTT